MSATHKLVLNQRLGKSDCVCSWCDPVVVLPEADEPGIVGLSVLVQ